MEKKIQKIKGIYNIDNIFPIAPIILKKEKVYLFFSKKENVNYSLYTDGDMEHLDTWIDKKPYNSDIFLQGCSSVKRFEFQITNANILLIEKQYQENILRNLYINEDQLYKIINNQLYKVAISEKEKLMIKKMEK